MNINVKLGGLLQQDRFKQMERKYPAGARVQEVIDELNLPRLHIGILLINGVHADCTAILTEGDKLVILPLLGGG